MSSITRMPHREFVVAYIDYELQKVTASQETAFGVFTKDPTSAFRFGYPIDIVICQERIKWLNQLLQSADELDIKQRIGYLLSNCIDNENKGGWETTVLRQKLKDLFVIAHDDVIDLGDFERFSVNM